LGGNEVEEDEEPTGEKVVVSEGEPQDAAKAMEER
jgi:hypothetical protein